MSTQPVPFKPIRPYHAISASEINRIGEAAYRASNIQGQGLASTGAGITTVQPGIKTLWAEITGVNTEKFPARYNWIRLYPISDPLTLDTSTDTDYYDNTILQREGESVSGQTNDYPAYEVNNRPVERGTIVLLHVDALGYCYFDAGNSSILAVLTKEGRGTYAGLYSWSAVNSSVTPNSYFSGTFDKAYVREINGQGALAPLDGDPIYGQPLSAITYVRPRSFYYNVVSGVRYPTFECDAQVASAYASNIHKLDGTAFADTESVSFPALANVTTVRFQNGTAYYYTHPNCVISFVLPVIGISAYSLNGDDVRGRSFAAYYNGQSLVSLLGYRNCFYCVYEHVASYSTTGFVTTGLQQFRGVKDFTSGLNITRQQIDSVGVALRRHISSAYTVMVNSVINPDGLTNGGGTLEPTGNVYTYNIKAYGGVDARAVTASVYANQGYVQTSHLTIGNPNYGWAAGLDTIEVSSSRVLDVVSRGAGDISGGALDVFVRSKGLIVDTAGYICVGTFGIRVADSTHITGANTNNDGSLEMGRLIIKDGKVVFNNASNYFTFSNTSNVLSEINVGGLMFDSVGVIDYTGGEFVFRDITPGPRGVNCDYITIGVSGKLIYNAGTNRFTCTNTGASGSKLLALAVAVGTLTTEISQASVSPVGTVFDFSTPARIPSILLGSTAPSLWLTYNTPTKVVLFADVNNDPAKLYCDGFQTPLGMCGSGTFTSLDGKTVTVYNGAVLSIV